MLKDNLSVCWKIRAWPGRVVHAPVAKPTDASIIFSESNAKSLQTKQ